MSSLGATAMAYIKIKLGIVVTHPIQYFSPLYGALSQESNLDVHVIYLSPGSLVDSFDPGFGKKVKWDVPLLEGHRHAIVRNFGLSRLGPLTHVNPGLLFELYRHRFDAVWIHGHNTASHLGAYATCRALGVPILLRGETHLGLRRSRFKSMVRRPLMSTFFRNVTAFLAIGQANREYYLAHGVPEHKVYLAPYVVDNDFFQRRSVEARSRRVEVRRKLGVEPEDFVVLFASKMIERKRPFDLLESFRRLRALRSDVRLILVGSGPLEMAARKFVKEHSLVGVSFAGFANQSRMPEMFAASDAFVLPSENEPYGLVVNEAMNAGLPVIVTDEVGAARDLVYHGENGFCYRCGDIDALTSSLERLVVDGALRASMGRRSLDIISRWGIPQAVAGVQSALADIRARKLG